MRKVFAAIAALPLLVAPAAVHAQGAQSGTATDFDFTAIDGDPMPLATFRGKVLLIVNVASFCGFTKQYAALQSLYERYERDGLVVIGVPSNDFGEQEPGSNAEIKTFCEGAFNVTFPLTERQAVKGATAHPFYRWARTTLGDAAMPRWNFHKYLVGRDGRLISAFSTNVESQSPQVIKAIEAALLASK
jgi:glutathione peroxidase